MKKIKNKIELVLITGVTGWVGRFLLKEAMNANMAIVALVRPKECQSPLKRLLALGFNMDELQDICIIESIEDLINHTNKPTKIIHCAANVDFVNDEFAESSNLGLTWDLLSYASTIHDFKCFIHVSTLSIRGDGNRTFSEDSLDIEQHFMTPYALTKFLGEIMIKRFHRNIPFCIVRLGTVLGWGSNEIFGINNDWLFQSVRLWIAGYLTALPLSPKQSFHLITPDAVARGLLCLLSKENLPSVLHMPTKPGPCVEEIFDLLSQKAKTKQPMLLAQDSVEWNAYRSSAKKRLRMVVDKIYPPPPPGLHVVDVDSSFSHAWFKNNGISVNDIPLSCLELIIPEVLKIIK